MRRTAALAILLCSSVLCGPRDARAQGEDARPLAPGTLRLLLAPDWSRWDRRFGRGTPGLADGALESLAADFSGESLGVAQLPFLAAEQERVRAAAALSGYTYNLGRARLTLNYSVRVMPLGAELALSRRLVVRAVVPLVRARVEAFLLGPDTGAVNAATRGNVGLNPDYVTPGSLTAFRGQVDALIAALQAQAATGPPALRAQAQATLDSITPALCGLYALGVSAFPSGATCAFGGGASPAVYLLPVAATPAGDSLTARLARSRSAYNATRASYAGAGVTLPVFDAAFGLPTAPLDSTSLRALFSDPAGRLGGDSLTSMVRTRLGDVELGAWYQVAARPAWRSQLAVTVRLPTGTVDSPHYALDLGTGTHQLGLDLAFRNDLVLRPDFWVHAAVRMGGSASGTLVRRVGPANALLLPLTDTATVERALGRYAALDLVPTWQLDDAFGLGIGVHWFRQGASRFRYADPAAEARIGSPAGVLNDETAAQRLRVGAGLTFSTLERYAAGRASLPYTVTAGFQKTFWGSGGKVEAASVVTLVIRGYVTMWRTGGRADGRTASPRPGQ